MPTHASASLRSACLVALALGAGCGAPGAESPESPWFEPEVLEVERGLSCVPGNACGGEGAVYTAVYRVGETATSRGELLQTFTALADGAPAKVSIVARKLRLYASATPPRLNAEVYGPVSPGATERGALPVLLSGSVALDELAPSGASAILLAGSGSLTAGGLYALRLWTDGMDASGSGSVLVGIGALVEADYPTGAAFRRGLRTSTPGGPFAEARFRPAGVWDLAFAFSGAEGSPCLVDDECSGELVCEAGSCADASALPSLGLSPGVVAFGGVAAGLGATSTVTLTNGLPVTATLVVGVPASPFSRTGTTCGATLAAGAQCTVTLAFNPSSVQAFSDALPLTFQGEQTTVPITGAGLAPRLVAVSAGYQTLVLKTDGTLWATGYNGSGQLGTGNTTQRTTFTQVLTNVKAMAAGPFASYAVRTDDTLWATGMNSSGQLGTGDTVQRTSFTQVLTGVAQVAAGSSHALALKTNGTLWTTGSNAQGQLGTGNNTTRSTFGQVLTGVKAIAAGHNQFSVAVKTDGTLWTTGQNVSGQLGTANNTARNTFGSVLTGVAEVAVGSDHTVARKVDGSVWSTGSNSSGQLGAGNTSDRNTFVQVATGAIAITAGGASTLVFKSGGALWGTGGNGAGQLGLGDPTNRTTFVSILPGTAFAAAGVAFTVAVKSDGSFWGTGYNSDGQLGLGDTTNRTVFTTGAANMP